MGSYHNTDGRTVTQHEQAMHIMSSLPRSYYTRDQDGYVIVFDGANYPIEMIDASGDTSQSRAVLRDMLTTLREQYNSAATKIIGELKKTQGKSTEQDPNGKSQHEVGAKLDAGKLRISLVFHGFAKALEEVGRVGTFGANKYADNGWVSVPNGIERYTDAAYRHLLAEAQGELTDPDSNILHAAHTAWNALARLDLILRKYDNA